MTDTRLKADSPTLAEFVGFRRGATVGDKTYWFAEPYDRGGFETPAFDTDANAFKLLTDKISEINGWNKFYRWYDRELGGKSAVSSEWSAIRYHELTDLTTKALLILNAIEAEVFKQERG